MTYVRGDASAGPPRRRSHTNQSIQPRTRSRKNRPRSSKGVVASIHSFAGRPRSLALHEKAGKIETVLLSVVAGKSATIAVYWAGPALGAVLGTGLFKTAYKGESKKKSKRKTR